MKNCILIHLMDKKKSTIQSSFTVTSIVSVSNAGNVSHGAPNRDLQLSAGSLPAQGTDAPHTHTHQPELSSFYNIKNDFFFLNKLFAQN